MSAKPPSASASMRATVRTRLFRAQRLLRTELSRRLEGESTEIFDFGAERCDRVVAHVLARLVR